MKKTLAVIIVAVMLTMSLVSCGDNFDINKVSLVDDGYVTLGDYANIDIDVASYTGDEPTDDEVYAHAVEHLDHSEAAVIEDRAAEEFDVVNIDFLGKIDGVEFEGGSASDQDLVIGADQFIEGFEDGIIGMNVGEAKDVAVTFPEDYHSAELAGKPAVFTITLNAIYDPAILDDVREELSAESGEADLRKDVWEALKACVTVNKYPEERVKTLAKSQYDYYEYMYRSMGMFQDMEDLGVTMDSCKEEVKTQIAEEFAIYALAEAQGITATDAELDAKIVENVADYVVNYGYTQEDAEAMFTKDTVRADVLYEKLIDNAIAKLSAETPAETTAETAAETVAE